MVKQVRPTLRALQMLPTDSYDSNSVLGTIARAKAATDPGERRTLLAGLRLGDLTHPLLDDARTRLADGAPDVHRAATKAASTKTTTQTIYEVRSRTGAAWRGALMTDDVAAWLVFAASHDKFHSTVATYIKAGSWRPSALDTDLARRDLERLRLLEWRTDLLVALLDHLQHAARTPGPSVRTTPPGPTGLTTDVRISVEHDAPAPTAARAHETYGLLQVTVVLGQDGWPVAEQLIALLAFIQNDGASTSQAFAPGGDLVLLLTVTHARLAQLTVSAPTLQPDPALLCPDPLTALHYVDPGALAAGFVQGAAVLALCGVVFVPQLDASAGLPVCDQCEELRPVATALLEHVRAQE